MKIQSPSTDKFKSTISTLLKNKEKFVSMGLGEPEVETPIEIKHAAHKALLEGYTKYSNPFGLEILREAISEKLKTEKNIESTPDQILVTPGGKNALFISCMGLVEDGDEVINITPGYVSNLPILNLASRNIRIKNIALKSPDFSLDRTELENSISNETKLILINFPNNPTGSILNRNDAEFLATLIKEMNIYLVSDEVYEKFVYSNNHISPAVIGTIKDKVLTIHSFSKSFFMTGWRIGYIHANSELIKELAKINLHINTNTATFIQMAALEALKMQNDIFAGYLKKIYSRRNKLREWLTKIFPDFQLPEGGLFVFLDISKAGMKSDDFAAELLIKEKVAVLPGINFGENYDNYCRVSLACHDNDFEEGLMRIVKFFENL